jgi:hypothetical protein
MGRDDDLREVLNATAYEFKSYDLNPSAWLTWIIYLLKELDLQSEGVNPIHQDLYVDMLSVLRDSIRNRLRTGGW